MFTRTSISETDGIKSDNILGFSSAMNNNVRRNFEDMRVHVSDNDKMRGPGSVERMNGMGASPVTHAFNSFVFVPIDKAQGKIDRTRRRLIIIFAQN